VASIGLVDWYIRPWRDGSDLKSVLDPFGRLYAGRPLKEHGGRLRLIFGTAAGQT